MNLFAQDEPTELFAQHSTEKPITLSCITKMLLECQDPKVSLSCVSLQIPSVISSVQLKRNEVQLWLLQPAQGFGEAKSWEVADVRAREESIARLDFHYIIIHDDIYIYIHYTCVH